MSPPAEVAKRLDSERYKSTSSATLTLPARVRVATFTPSKALAVGWLHTATQTVALDRSRSELGESGRLTRQARRSLLEEEV